MGVSRNAAFRMRFVRCIDTLLLSARALPALVRAEGPPVQVDAASGLWFPPYASPADYLQRDPNHPYLKDVQRAWSEQPGLRQQVCAAVQKVTPMTADPAIHQPRALLDMQCIGGAASQHLATQQAAK